MTADFPIADAHQHFWDPLVNYHPWLCDEPPIAFRYGDYRAIRRPYLPAAYFADAGAHRVVALFRQCRAMLGETDSQLSLTGSALMRAMSEFPRGKGVTQ